MLEIVLFIVAVYGLIITVVNVGLIYLLLTGRLITKRELDNQAGLTVEWKGVALRVISGSEMSTTLAQKTTQVMEELVTKQLPTPTPVRD